MTRPVDTGLGVAPPRRLRSIDFWRLKEFERRRELGESEEVAWLAVVLDKTMGYRKWKGGDSVPAHALAKTYQRFMARVAPAEFEAASIRIKHVAAQALPRMLQTVIDIADGKVEDASLANARRTAAAYMLDASGFSGKRSGQADGVTVNVAAQAAAVSGSSAHDLTELLASEDAARSAADLETALEVASRRAQEDA